MGQALKDINDETIWSQFIAKLCEDTLSGKLHWSETKSFRYDSVGPVYVALVAASKYIGVYRYQYSEDEYSSETKEEVAVEIVDESGERKWRLPQTTRRYELIDIVEYLFSGADELLKAYVPDAVQKRNG